MASLYLFLGRFCLSVIFILAGLGKFMDFGGTAAHMSAEGLPMAHVLLVIAALIEVLGGFSLLLGWKTRYSAVLLLLFLLPVTYFFHDFWSLTGKEQQMEMIQFLKNLAIFGGLLYVASAGPGKYSIDRA